MIYVLIYEKEGDKRNSALILLRQVVEQEWSLDIIGFMQNYRMVQPFDKTLSVFLNDSDCVQIVLVTDCVETLEKRREEKMVGLYLLVVEISRQDSL